MRKVVIATRGSKLALWQAEYVKSELEKNFPNHSFALSIIKTTGDKILDTPLSKIGGKGLFTKEIEEAMLKGEAEIAVHSLKDFPITFPENLKLSAITKREDVRDAMMSFKYKSINELPLNAIVGTTSLRRKMQLLKNRPDLVIKDLRGNVNTRIEKLKNGEFDAIILAMAGINRLNLAKEVNFVYPIPTEIMIPAMGQASLGIETIDDDEIIDMVLSLNDEKSYIETKIERDFIKTLDGGCQVPIGIYADLKDETITVNAIIGTPDGLEMISESVVCDIDDFLDIGEELALMMIDKGAKELLAKAMNS